MRMWDDSSPDWDDKSLCDAAADCLGRVLLDGLHIGIEGLDMYINIKA